MLRKLFNRFEDYLVGIVLLGMSFLVFGQVLSRHFLHRSFSFTEEIVRYLLIWATMLGTAAAAHNRAHLGIKLLSGRLGGRGRRALRTVGDIATAALFGVVCVSSICVLKLQIETGQRTPGLAWPMAWATLSVTVGSALVVVRAVQVLVRDSRKGQ